MVSFHSIAYRFQTMFGFRLGQQKRQKIWKTHCKVFFLLLPARYMLGIWHTGCWRILNAWKISCTWKFIESIIWFWFTIKSSQNDKLFTLVWIYRVEARKMQSQNESIEHRCNRHSTFFRFNCNHLELGTQARLCFACPCKMVYIYCSKSTADKEKMRLPSWMLLLSYHNLGIFNS